MGKSLTLDSVPVGLINCPITPFTSNNQIDFDTFSKVVEFLLKINPAALCVNLHLAESLNLSINERKLLARSSVEISNDRAPVIVNVSTPGTDHAVDLALNAEEIGADCIMAIAPYYWKPPDNAVYDHFSAIMSATDLPFIGYNSPMIMDGVGISPDVLKKLLDRFPQFIGIKDASHNWEVFLELGRVAHSIKENFSIFVGTEWIIPSLTLGSKTCMSIFSGVAPKFVQNLYNETSARNMERALALQYKYSEIYQITKVEYPAPTKAMWEIMGRPVGGPRGPQRAVTSEGMKSLEKTLDRLGFLESEPHGW
jgi:4-hydroxy-tetrahydrodipicolinate synthase